jgi:hypothetical protein
VNFLYLDENSEVSIIDLMQTREGINKIKKILSQQIITALEIQPQITLNLTRHIASGNVMFNFNYHHEVKSATSASTQIRGSVSRCYKDALQLLEAVYELSDVEVVKHSFQQ